MQSAEFKTLAQTNKLYQSLDPQELEFLLAHAKQVLFSSGETIIQQGKKSAGIYVILAGTVIIAGQVFGEGRVSLASLKKGSIFGGSSVIVNGPNATSVIAETEVQCLLISTALFEMFSLFYPSMKYKIMKEIAENSCNRLITVADKIRMVVSGMDMKARPIFGQFVESLTKPAEVSYEDVSLDRKQLEAMPPISIFNNDGNALLKSAIILLATNQCTLIEEAQKDCSSYFVVKGAVQSSIVEKKRVAKISILGPGSLFFPIPLINDQFPSRIHYTTCERSILLKVDQKFFNELQHNNIKLWYKLFDLLCESLIVLVRFTEKLDIRVTSEIYNR